VPHVIAPVVGHDDRYFWDGVAEGKLLLRKCAKCSHLQHPPTPMCPRCGSLEWTTQEASGRGTVYSWIVSHHPTQPDAEPRIVALIALEEGLRMVSNIVDAGGADVRNDMDVEVCFRTYDDVTLPQFRPVGS
jgi:uncharacterized OB-fold protein